jgi:hypothetical protein
MTTSIIWRITKYAEKKSKYHADTYTQITFLDEDTGDIAVTNVDSVNQNSTYWQDIIQALNEDNDVWIDNLKYKTQHGVIVQDKYTNIPVIDADSMPVIQHKQLTAEAQQNLESRTAFAAEQLRRVTEYFEQDTNGKWIVNQYVTKQNDFIDGLKLTAGDDAADMRAKLDFQAAVRYAQGLNLGLYR